MTSKRIYFVMVGVIVLLIGAIIGGAYLANSQLQKQAGKLTDFKTRTAILKEEQTGLTQAKKDITKYESLDKIAKTIVPQDKDQAKTVREIVKIAAESGIKPTAINFPNSTLGGTASSSAGAAASSAAPTAAASGAAAKQSALSQLTPVKGIKGVYNLQIVVQQDAASPVPYSKFIDFLSRLENNRRTAQVTSIVLQPSALNPSMVSFTLTLDEFIKP